MPFTRMRLPIPVTIVGSTLNVCLRSSSPSPSPSPSFCGCVCVCLLTPPSSHFSVLPLRSLVRYLSRLGSRSDRKRRCCSVCIFVSRASCRLPARSAAMSSAVRFSITPKLHHNYIITTPQLHQPSHLHITTTSQLHHNYITTTSQPHQPLHRN